VVAILVVGTNRPKQGKAVVSTKCLTRKVVVARTDSQVVAATAVIALVARNQRLARRVIQASATVTDKVAARAVLAAPRQQEVAKTLKRVGTTLLLIRQGSHTLVSDVVGAGIEPSIRKAVRVVVIWSSQIVSKRRFL
jgi:hypothetical protein